MDLRQGRLEAGMISDPIGVLVTGRLVSPQTDSPGTIQGGKF